MEMSSDPERLFNIADAVSVPPAEAPDVTIVRGEIQREVTDTGADIEPVVASEQRRGPRQAALPESPTASHEAAPPPEPAPDLHTFLGKLGDPDYRPPEYTPDPAAASGFKVPEGTPPAEQDTTRVVLQLEANFHEYGVTCIAEGNTEEVVLNPVDTTAYVQRFGGKKFAADVRIDPETGMGTVTAVHGVEPVYRGEPLNPEQPPKSLLVEGQVTEIRGEVDLAGFLDRGWRTTKLPMMRVQIDPSHPERGIWLPRENMDNLASEGGRATDPLPGDTVQVRTIPQIIDIPGLGKTSLPHSIAGDRRHAPMVDSAITKAGMERRRQDTRHEIKTAALVNYLEATRDPKEVAVMVNNYLAMRLRTGTFVGRQTYEASHLAITDDELQRVQRAVAHTPADGADRPALLLAASDAGTARYPAGTHPVEQLVQLNSKWRKMGILTGSESITNMTAGELGDAAQKFISHELLYLDQRSEALEHAPPSSFSRPLEPALSALDAGTKQRVIGNVVANLETVPQYQLFWQPLKRVIADLYDEAPLPQRHAIIRMVADAARTMQDIIRLGPTYGENHKDNLTDKWLTAASRAISFEDPAVRERSGITDTAYQEYRQTAKAVRGMFGLLGNEREHFLTPAQRDILFALDRMNLD